MNAILNTKRRNYNIDVLSHSLSGDRPELIHLHIVNCKGIHVFHSRSFSGFLLKQSLLRYQ